MFVMQKKADKWPMEVKAGSVTVKIYRTVNRGRAMFTLAYHEAGGRKLRQFADLADARREAKETAATLNAGRGAALELSGADRDAYLAAVRQLKPLDVPLNVARRGIREGETVQRADRGGREVLRRDARCDVAR